MRGSVLLEKNSTKVPKAELNYTVDWEAWLGEDTIATSVWNVPADLVKVTQSVDVTNTKAIVKIRGGVVGETYTVINRITTTTSGELDERSFQIRVVERKED